MKYQLETQPFLDFQNRFNHEERYKHLRLGQAFVQDFGLDKMNNKAMVDRMYQLDGKAALSYIGEVFDFV